MSTPLQKFFRALNEQEEKFLPILASDNMGILLRAAINEVDWYAYNLAKCRTASHEQDEQFYLLHLGVSRLVKLALDARPSFDVPTVLFRRHRRTTIPVLEIAAGLGMIQHGRRVAQTAMSGFAEVSCINDREFHITLPRALPDNEYYERAVAAHYRSLQGRRLGALLDSDMGKRLHVGVDDLLTDLVYPFREHFIGYHAHPTLDSYFFGLAMCGVQMDDVHDSFQATAEFGGISFQHYVLATTFLVSLAIKHQRFAEALAAKHPSVQLDNVLTVSAETSSFIGSMNEAINFFGDQYYGCQGVDAAQAHAIFDVLSVGRDNTDLLDRPGCALPALVRCSDHDVIRSQAGAHAAPGQFLLNALRYHFPRDYDRHQTMRETAMQCAIRRVLDGVYRRLEYRNNIVIKSGRDQLTDLDLVIAEQVSGIVLLVQIKHQDPYGMDIHSRQLRTERLKGQTVRWLASTSAWIEMTTEAQRRQTLQLRKSFPKIRMSRVIVARHYGFPIGTIDRAEDVVFSNWNMFFNAVQLVKGRRTDPTLDDLMRALREHEQPEGSQEYYPEPRTAWIIDDLKFTTQQQQ